MRLIDQGCITVAGRGVAQVQEAAQGLLARGARSLMLLAADGNDCQPQDFDPWLRLVPVPLFGGVFPQLIFDGRNHETGYLLLGLQEACQVRIVDGLSSPGADYPSAITRALGEAVRPPTMMLLVDGLASQIGSFLDGVYDVLGGGVSYFGGGAGSLSFQHKPCLFSNQGMLMDKALMISLPGRVQLGVEHGWEKFAGPFGVTAASRNIVSSLDFRPAFDVYRERVEADSGLRFADQDFFAIAKGYPLGMEKADGSLVVRDPIACQDGSLVCVGEVPSNAVVYLLKGRPERLIDAARASARRIPAGDSPAFLVDCISRVLFLQDRFPQEIAAVKGELGSRPLLGILTLGEIANGGDYCLEFYNKTLVLAAAR